MTKAERTRAALMQAALELFEQHGYDSTTATAIAERAGVSEMTFFRYFPSKASVLMANPYDPRIAETIARQPAELSPLAAAVAGVAEAWSSLPAPASSEVRDRLRIVSKTPSLRGAVARNNLAAEDSIAGALASRGASKMDARITAAAMIGALSAAILEWADGDDHSVGDAIHAALHVLRGDRQ